MLIKENVYGVKRGVLLPMIYLFLLSGLSAQTEYDFPAGNYWSLDGGLGISNILVEGQSFQFIIEPKLWLSPALTVGSKIGANLSNEDDSRNILTFEGQVFMRWNFLHLGKNWDKKTSIFVQGGLGLLASYRGQKNPFDDVTETRGSLLVDAALGATIPLTPRWHIEPSIRGGYPHMYGFSITAGYKFPLPQNTHSVEYRDVIKNVPASEIVKIIKIAAIEFVIFGPDIGNYNIGIDRDAQQLNELVLNGTAQMLKENPAMRARIEGHANPFTINKSEHDDLMALSTMRANVVAEQLRRRGVSDEQIVIIAFGGTRAATSDWDVRNRNRRVEVMLIQVDPEN